MGYKNKEVQKLYNKKYNLKNRDRLRKKKLEYYYLNKDKMDSNTKEYRKSDKYWYLCYKRKCDSKNELFDFSELEFKIFTNKPCYYCNRKFTRVGIDRVDNTIGYTKDNCVPCCKQCNISKNNLSLDKFYEMCELVYINRIKKQ
jgi:hypothetical protein